MNLYYINGDQVQSYNAYAHFCNYSPARYEVTSEEMAAIWDSCQVSESERDIYLPASLEIVQA